MGKYRIRDALPVPMSRGQGKHRARHTETTMPTRIEKENKEKEYVLLTLSAQKRQERQATFLVLTLPGHSTALSQHPFHQPTDVDYPHHYLRSLPFLRFKCAVCSFKSCLMPVWQIERWP